MHQIFKMCPLNQFIHHWNLKIELKNSKNWMLLKKDLLSTIYLTEAFLDLMNNHIAENSLKQFLRGM
ncbi:hypothetical protein AYI68_g6255 [Smittium mucronatum]|uniref:Uncharacterized protein n=1 Tax=Smittium mucronatum TaxID=133383 RepID=A0A1R0GS07_9FUNG|nr:hypothetical protein AYI68_g6255 [Smittium mucronatum]